MFQMHIIKANEDQSAIYWSIAVTIQLFSLIKHVLLL